MTTKTYSELSSLGSFEEKFDYLAMGSSVGFDTFGCDRIFNQMFYHSEEWKRARRRAILRDSDGDLCYDLGDFDHPIARRVVVHHINPITIEDIHNADPCLFDLENLICCDEITHKAIHYGSFDLIDNDYVERSEFDTCPWKKGGNA